MLSIQTFSVLSLIANFAQIDGHAAMNFPLTRNVLIPHDCSTCANEGQSVCGGLGQWKANNVEASKLNSVYTTPLTNLVAGGKVDIELFFKQAHKGHFALELCANPESTITETCFKRLDRDPSDTRYSPYLPEVADHFFLPENTCLTSGITEMNPLRARFLIPDTTISEHAVLRWYWQTGNSCDSSLYNKRDPLTPVHEWSAQINGRTCRSAISNIGILCGDDCPRKPCRMEQWKNCADVKIVKGDKSQTVTSSNAIISKI